MSTAFGSQVSGSQTSHLKTSHLKTSDPQTTGPKTVGLIPARGGSKGLPGKNIIPLNGIPLLAYSIEAALDSNVCDQLIVSSDAPEVLSVAEEYGAQVHQRAASLAQDDTPTDDVIADVIHAQYLHGNDIIVLLQPTSPLRTQAHIRAALDLYRNTCAQMLMSVCEIPGKYLNAYLRNDEFLEPAFSAAGAVHRRQDLPPLYIPNGAIYVFSVADFNRHNSIPRQRIVPFVMDEACSVDVDTEEDLRRCADILNGRGN